jgi:hypothetical protein
MDICVSSIGTVIGTFRISILLRPSPVYLGISDPQEPEHIIRLRNSTIGGNPMISCPSLLVSLVKLVDRLPEPPQPARKRGRGRPTVYPNKLFLKALIIMIVCHLHKVGELLSVLEQPT